VTDHYIVVLEDAGANYCAYIPDLPGCVSTGTTIEETVAHIREAMAFHLETMRRDGENVPPVVHHLTDRLEFADSAIGIIELTAAPAVAA
jgi:predicted RNase H-like HicB family nuclease